MREDSGASSQESSRSFGLRNVLEEGEITNSPKTLFFVRVFSCNRLMDVQEHIFKYTSTARQRPAVAG
jgi:hypothetical protein